MYDILSNFEPEIRENFKQHLRLRPFSGCFYKRNVYLYARVIKPDQDNNYHEKICLQLALPDFLILEFIFLLLSWKKEH